MLHQVVTAQLAAARSGTQSTKTRAEVRGAGQAVPPEGHRSGPGRFVPFAHLGGGGVALGPKPRSYAPEDPEEDGATGPALGPLGPGLPGPGGGGRRLDLRDPEHQGRHRRPGHARRSGRALVVLGDEDGYADRSFGNLPEVQTIMVGELNAYDILVNDWVVFTDETLPGGAPADPRPPPPRHRPTAGGTEATGDDATSAATDDAETATDDAEEEGT